MQPFALVIAISTSLSLALTAHAQEKVPASPVFMEAIDARLPAQGTIALVCASNLAYASDLFGDGSDDVVYGAKLSILAAAFDFLSLGISLGTRADNHSSRVPAVSQTVGDPALLMRGGVNILPWLTTSAHLELGVPTSGTGFGLAFPAISPRFTAAIGTHFDFGLVATLNVGFTLERSEQAFESALDPILRFSANVADTPMVTGGLAVGYNMSLMPNLALMPLVETTIRAPVSGVDTATGTSGLAGLGLRVGVGKHEELAITGGAQIAYLRPDHMNVAIPAVPFWSAQFGVAYAFDPFTPPPSNSTSTTAAPPPPQIKEVIKTERVEVEKPSGRIKGAVVDSVSKTPIVDAVVIVDGTDASPLAVDGADASFTSFPLEANRPYKFKVVAAGYEVGEINAMVGADAVRTVSVELVRTGAAQFGELRGVIKASDGSPLAASIVISGVKGGRLTTNPETGSFQMTVPVGSHTVAVGAPGYKTQKKRIHIRPGDVVILNVDLAR